MRLMLVIIFGLIRTSWSRNLSIRLLNQCQDMCNPSFNCNCERANWLTLAPKCISTNSLCDGFYDCEDGSDEIECSCPEGEVQCSRRFENGDVLNNLYQCISIQLTNDTKEDCLSGSDANEETSHCEGDSLSCDGYIHCPRLTPNDEANCSSCPKDLPNRCDCNKPGDMTCKGNGYVCYAENGRCDQHYECVDKSDELNCVCPEHHFQCQCYKNDPVSCSPSAPGCIPLSQYHDGVKDCSDGSDETQFNNTVSCDECEVTVSRLTNVTECNETDFLSCSTSTCQIVSSIECHSNDCAASDLICVSNCSTKAAKKCEKPFQCNDGSLGLAFQFCNGIFDCPDNSDEVRDQPGFKCFGIESKRTCVLPQRNLYDNVSQCSDESDLCANNSCFQCFDRRLLISSQQVCDGVFDCYDFSDECLCDASFDKPLCVERFPSNDPVTLECIENNDSNSSKTNFNPGNNLSRNHSITCQTKWNDRFEAISCDGRPECRDFSDECECDSVPLFCNDTCHADYFIGDRYCDGIEDEFYKIINKTNCPKGFDEVNCPKRFYCPAGRKISIDISYKCDGKNDCDDKSDEYDCPSNIVNAFSSFQEMIADFALRIVFWIIGLIAAIGNLYVIISILFFLNTMKLNQSYKYQAILMLNISVADLIMGIYLIAISVFSLLYSGVYGQVDSEWRLSLPCSIIGSLILLSSEASCFFLAFLTVYRLYAIFKPLNAAVSSTVRLTVCIVLIWLISLALAIVPIFYKEIDYFAKVGLYSNKFSHFQLWDQFNVTKLACRLSKLSNVSIENNGREWVLTQKFLINYFPEYIPVKQFGYYGQNSVCMPKFYLGLGDVAWEYTTAVICLNCLLFLFILNGYIVIFASHTKNKVELKDKKYVRLQRRISRITISNLICWLVICTIFFIKIGGVWLSISPYIISVAVLLTINSALNPLLYSPLCDKLVESCQKNDKTEASSKQEN